MSLLFKDFASWRQHCADTGEPLYRPVLTYEAEQKGRTETEVRAGLRAAYQVMQEAVETGLRETMRSRSGMVDGGGQRIFRSSVTVLSPEFQRLVARAVAAKEVNSCMGRVVAAPTAGASGILPGVLTTLQEVHGLDEARVLEGMLVAAGVALII
ncbi:MAG: L-serine ammonia-lyase, iron-sulfur-dependent, subunit alpha, partial [Catalinimonas sp.]